ncbi:MAG: NAD-dependent deacylase [Micromonosporaceae bacterium]|nr:NAD-dependent deacylase [Micromonosporaceae bacterium]
MLERASEALRGAQRVVVFTGAGMSAESGIPTFRDAMTGLWARYDPAELATPQAFRADPELVWGWYEWRRALVSRAQPNAGHVAVAAIEAHVPGTVVVTQNVDDLHERAGSSAPIRLHGSLFAPRCSACAAPAPVPAVVSTAVSIGTLAADGDVDPEPEGQRLAPPICTGCGGLVRPGVVWFGESLPADALKAAVDAAARCDLLLAVGTSGVVYPAAEIPEVAARHGAMVIQINPQPTALDGIAALNLRGSAASVLPALVAAAWPGQK